MHRRPIARSRRLSGIGAAIIVAAIVRPAGAVNPPG